MSSNGDHKSKNEAYRFEVSVWYGMMMGAAAAMPEHEKRELEEWEKTHLDGSTVGTDDWPGWEKYIGKRPVPPEPAAPFSKRPIPEGLRWQVWLRDNFTCVVCGARRDLTVDHVKPESLGGTMELPNLQTLCRPCNSRKGARHDPSQESPPNP